MKYPETGDKVSFRLDGRCEGSGKVVIPDYNVLPKRAFEIELDAPCKEYKAGDKVIVWLEEIVACPA